MFVSRGRGLWVSMALAGLVLAGCGTRMTRAPVEDRGTAVAAQPGEVVAAPAVKPLPGAENAGKPGYYTVKPGDTLIRIGLDTGQSWKDLARWNNMDNPNLIEVGQVLRVVPPVAVVAAPVVPDSGGVVTRPVSAPSVAPAPAPVASAPRTAASNGAAATAPAVVGAPEHERCILWNDPELAIPWPLTGAPTLSAKDVNGLPFAVAELFP